MTLDCGVVQAIDSAVQAGGATGGAEGGLQPETNLRCAAGAAASSSGADASTAPAGTDLRRATATTTSAAAEGEIQPAAAGGSRGIPGQAGPTTASTEALPRLARIGEIGAVAPDSTEVVLGQRGNPTAAAAATATAASSEENLPGRDVDQAGGAAATTAGPRVTITAAAGTARSGAERPAGGIPGRAGGPARRRVTSVAAPPAEPHVEPVARIDIDRGVNDGAVAAKGPDAQSHVVAAVEAVPPKTAPATSSAHAVKGQGVHGRGNDKGLHGPGVGETHLVHAGADRRGRRRRDGCVSAHQCGSGRR